MRNLPPDYRERTYAGWLGKCIGVRLGAPLENWTHDEIRDNLGEVTDFLPLPPGKIFKPDDDTAFPMVMIRALQDYGPDVSAQEMGQTVLNYLARERGTFWWGGYGVSTEHTAYRNLAAGIPAPSAGSIALNGETLAQQIGGQIFSDIWGMVAPAPGVHPSELAADYAARASSVTHDGEGIHGGRFIAGLVSAAYAESDPVALGERGLALVPEDSEYARVVRAVLDFYRQHPHDWHACYRFLHDNFGYDRYPGVVHIIPNAGVVVMALLYSEGDFSRGIQIATMAGWDTDCNVGNVGAILGVAVGLDGIDHERWRTPMNDLLVTASVIGVRNLLTIPACADLFCDLGEEIAGVRRSRSERRPRYHFRYPGSTQGFHSRGQKGTVIDLRQITVEDAATEGHPHPDGALQATVRKLNKKGEIGIYIKTYLRPGELSANYYGASFSPTIWPGQTVSARVFLPAGAPDTLRAALFVRDDNAPQIHQARGDVLIPGEWTTIRYTVPPLHNALLTEAGIVVRNLGEPWSGRLLLHWLDWQGAPHFSTDFACERSEYDAISGWTFSQGYWRLDNCAFHGSGADLAEAYTGDVDWRDLSLTVDLVPVVGDYHNVNLRVQGTRRSYAVGLASRPGDTRRIVLYKNVGGYRPVADAVFAWQHGERYRLHVVANGAELRVAAAALPADGEDAEIAEQPLLLWTDMSGAYLHGQIGFSNFQGSHTRYERVAVEGMAT